MDIIEALSLKGITYKTTNNPNELLVQCTSGNHDDNSPSMQYNLEKNIFHCWSCGYSGGSTKFLESIGIKTKLPIESKQPFKINKLKNKLNERIEYGNLSLPKDFKPAYGTFKNIGPTTFKEFNAFFTDEFQLDGYLCIPVYQFGKLRFIEGRNRFSGTDKPKYMRRPAGATVVNLLFPIDKLHPSVEIIIVEGLFDMMNLWQHGYHNVVCTFGTQNFGEKKIELLDKLGITSVKVMMDGDSAGVAAAQKITRLLEKYDFQTTTIKLPSHMDPGGLSADEIKYYLSNS